MTTAALAAGVDFPASQVISSSGNGNRVDFRTGLPTDERRCGQTRLSRSRSCRAYACAEKIIRGSQSDTEEEVAIRLLQGEMLSVGVEYGEAEQLEEILASIAVTSSVQDLGMIHNMMFGSFDLEKLILRLQSYRFVERKCNRIMLTQFGKVIASHFLPVSKAFLIRDAVLTENDPLRSQQTWSFSMLHILSMQTR